MVRTLFAAERRAMLPLASRPPAIAGSAAFRLWMQLLAHVNGAQGEAHFQAALLPP